MVKFLSLYFNGIVTFLTGIIALGIYLLKKRDAKINAARAILGEIQHAEIAIDEIKNTGLGGNLTSVLQTNAWAQFGHLFMRDLDFLEQRAILNFYNTCKILQRIVEFRQNERLLQLQEGGFELQRRIIDLSLQENDVENYSRKVEQMKNRYHSSTYWFEQNGSKEIILNAAQKIEKVSVTSAGITLKKIAKIN